MKLCKKNVLLYMARLVIDQQALAERSGVSRATISAAINGRKCNPVLLGKISKALDTDPENIIEDE